MFLVGGVGGRVLSMRGWATREVRKDMQGLLRGGTDAASCGMYARRETARGGGQDIGGELGFSILKKGLERDNLVCPGREQDEEGLHFNWEDEVCDGRGKKILFCSFLN